jgi:hypothetical protein
VGGTLKWQWLHGGLVCTICYPRTMCQNKGLGVRVFICYVIFLNFCVVLMAHDKFCNNFTVKRLGKTMKISVISEAFVSDMRCRWCHGHTAVAICHSHWMHCRPFCCTKHENKPKMTADTMASQLWIMMLCSVRRHSCHMHMWVTSCTHHIFHKHNMMYEHTLCHCVPPPIQMSMWRCLYKIVQCIK